MMGLFDELFAPNSGWLGAALAQRPDETTAGAASAPSGGNVARGALDANPFGALSGLMPPLLLPPSRPGPSPLPGVAAGSTASLDERAYGSPGQPGPPLSLAPSAAPQDIGLGDRLSAGLLGFLNGHAPLPALGNLIEGLATGQRADRRR